ncbi:hypothetical protein B0F90DRAFT_1695370 [Multifurca ochricompacta]|uniref:Uncharacterized protein n=1 Tax=Multifurca ochricompacta TaxID=376703 RepID=A0AAD4M9J2_9AGAM|nr:hypothetical protein B0F90DRAFT_1695370 [Multifurca ochricompacta]
MPPQQGVFSLPYLSTHKARANPTEIHNGTAEIVTSYPPLSHHTIHHTSALLAGPSSRPHGANIDDGKKDRRRKEIVGRLGKEMNDRRDDGRQYAESISALHSVAMQLAARPETLPSYTLRLYPLSLERSALLAQLAVEERNSLESAESAYELERERVEEEWKRGRDRIRERLLEGIEERRRRAREEKDGEGTVSEATLDSQSRPHITRKLRNRLGTSPPPTPLALHPNGATNGMGPTLPGPVTNPHSLSVDELPSPFPLPLTATSLPNMAAGNAGGNGWGFQVQAVGGLGKSGASLAGCKETEIESDLGEIRRGNKRRRGGGTVIKS